MLRDIVYIYGCGYSSWRENELKYSLRSLAKYGRNFNRVFIIGDFPEYINGEEVFFIPFEEDKQKNKEKNIHKKISAICNEAIITDEFIMFNDDYFLTKEIDFAALPYYYHLDLKTKIQNRKTDDTYKEALKNTYKILIENNKPTLHYDIHYPMVINKTKYLSIMRKYNWNIRDGYVIKSLYCNDLEVVSLEKQDYKLGLLRNLLEIDKIFNETDLVSTGELTREVINKITDLYPDRCLFEKKCFEIK